MDPAIFAAIGEGFDILQGKGKKSNKGGERTTKKTKLEKKLWSIYY